MLSKELIEKRINKFLGYGNLDSDIWFIGVEEGLADGTSTDLEKRFKRIEDESVVDIQDESDVQGHMKWFLPNSKLQRTWCKLILILLTLKSNNEKITNDRIKEFQRNEFGRLNSNHVVLNLCHFHVVQPKIKIGSTIN